MTQTRDDRIRARAYELWQADGGKLGDDWAYWLKAEQELSAANDSAPAPAPAKAPKKPATSAKKANGQAAAAPAAAKPAAKSPAKPKKATTSAGPASGKR